MVLTEERKIRSTVTNKFDKWFSHCLPEGRVRGNDVGEGEYGKQHSCEGENKQNVNLITGEKLLLPATEL